MASVPVGMIGGDADGAAAGLGAVIRAVAVAVGGSGGGAICGAGGLGRATGRLVALAVSPSSGAAVVLDVAAAKVRSRDSNESAVETLGDERSQPPRSRAAAIGAMGNRLFMCVIIRTILIEDYWAPCGGRPPRMTTPPAQPTFPSCSSFEILSASQ